MRSISMAEIEQVSGGVTGVGVCEALFVTYGADIGAAVAGGLASETGPGAFLAGMAGFSFGGLIGQAAGDYFCS